MGKKNGTPKSRQRKALRANPCGCYYCSGTIYEEWLQLKYGIKPKHRKDYTREIDMD